MIRFEKIATHSELFSFSQTLVGKSNDLTTSEMTQTQNSIDSCKIILATTFQNRVLFLLFFQMMSRCWSRFWNICFQ